MRGREIFASRDAGNCVLCHSAPGLAASGNIGPPAQGVGARLNAAQLRLRVVDITRVNPDAAMPAFHRTDGLSNVASRYRGQPVLSAQQVEDVVAWLGTLK
ncbi:MAG: sulfur oxidation c-type cytochrome SoxX [Betaproteobacteria bacterium]